MPKAKSSLSDKDDAARGTNRRALRWQESAPNETLAELQAFLRA